MTGYTPDIDADDDWGDVSGDEISHGSYATGTLAGQDVTVDDANDRAVFDGTDYTFSSLDVGTPSHLVMYDDTHGTDALIAYWVLGSTASNGGDYTIQWGATGIILLT